MGFPHAQQPSRALPKPLLFFDPLSSKSPRGCAKGPQPLRLPSAGVGVYPAEERFFYPSAHKKRMKPHAPSVPETAYLLFSREPPGEFERAATLSTFLRIPATCAPRRPPSPRGCAKGPQPLRLPSAGGGVYPAEERFYHPSAHKNGCSPTLHPFPKQLISFSAGNLRESLRGPQPSQLSFVSRRPARPAFPPSPGMRDFSIRQRTKNGCSPMPHPFPKQLISFSAGNLRESLRGPQPFQLSFVSRRPAHPAAPLPRGCAKGPQPLRLSFRRRGRAPRRGAIFPSLSAQKTDEA